MAKFDELKIGDRFVDTKEGFQVQAYEKKSLSTAYALFGGKNGELVRDENYIERFSKKNPVIRLA